MCGLFGFSNYSGSSIKDLSVLTNSLAQQSSIRGTDATGISYCTNKGIEIYKEPKSAYKIEFKHTNDITALIGHTRHATQGNERKNFNNHPFKGSYKSFDFALCHNGVLSNDKSLRKKYNLPKTKIETDSYIAVQLLESQPRLNFDSIKYMAEKTEGSFSYSILDKKNNVYLVKGDSPLSIIHFPKSKLYVYASTDEILYKSLIDSFLFAELKTGQHETINLSEGDILKICPDGTTEKGTFEYNYYYGYNWWNYGSYIYKSKSISTTQEEYIESLKSVAIYQGLNEDIIDELLKQGFSLDEIEEYIYEF